MRCSCVRTAQSRVKPARQVQRAVTENAARQWIGAVGQQPLSQLKPLQCYRDRQRCLRAAAVRKVDVEAARHELAGDLDRAGFRGGMPGVLAGCRLAEIGGPLLQQVVEISRLAEFGGDQ